MPKPSGTKTILITSGPTIEPLDPVRYLSNYSTGKMGHELAKTARKMGYRVIFISGPTTLGAPKGVKLIPVKTAVEMKKAVLKSFARADCAIMAAAVSDFRPVFRKNKIKKGSKQAFSLRLKRNPDILSELARVKGRRLLAGYSLETERPVENAKRKLKAKKLDVIVVNRAGKGCDPFGPGAKDAAIIDRTGFITRLKGVSKARIAQILLDKLKTLW